MRIAQFTESFTPVINGAAVAVRLLAESLGERHEVEVYAPRFRGHVDPAGVTRFPSYCLPGHPEYPLALPLAPRLFRDFRRRGFDVVHTHSPFALGQAGRAWARQAGIPLVTTYHTLYVEYAHYARGLPTGLVRAYLRRLSAGYCNACDAVVVPTPPIRDVLAGYGVRRPIAVIPTGLVLREPAAEDPAFPRGALGIPAGAPLALYAGRLAREKNLEVVLSAFARVRGELPEARLLLCGEGPEGASLRATAAKLGLDGTAVFAGAVPPDRMRAVYAAADVFVFASVTDTQGLVITEAKAAGVPAVAVDAYGPSTVVRDGVDGLLVPNDAAAFAGALARLLGDRTLREELRTGALREARRYSIEATAAAYEQVYAEARGIANRRPAP